MDKLQRRADDAPAFMTIRQAAALGILTEHRLRLMVKQQACPGIYVGSRFLVNVGALIDQLQAESLRCGVAEHAEASS